MGPGRMAGEPWHKTVLKLSEGDTKRDQRRCIYFLKMKEGGRCQYLGGPCATSTYCKYYEENKVVIDEVEAPSVGKQTTPSIDLTAILKPTMAVKHGKYGHGYVASVSKDDVTIRFDDGTERTLRGIDIRQWLKIVDE